MGKKNKNKKKKVSVKKEKYAKFKKEKSSTMDVTFPDISEEQMRNVKENEQRIERFWKINRNPPTKEIRERKMLSKR